MKTRKAFGFMEKAFQALFTAFNERLNHHNSRIGELEDKVKDLKTFMARLEYSEFQGFCENCKNQVYYKLKQH